MQVMVHRIATALAIPGAADILLIPEVTPGRVLEDATATCISRGLQTPTRELRRRLNDTARISWHLDECDAASWNLNVVGIAANLLVNLLLFIER